MSQPPLKSLHSESSLILAKIAQYGKLSTQEIIASLQPGQPGSLKVKPDGTMHENCTLLDRGPLDRSISHRPSPSGW